MTMVTLSDGTTRPAPVAGAPLTEDVAVVALRTCPACAGRGWFLINPFATGGSNGAGGLSNMTQCEQCLRSYEYYQQHGVLPSEDIPNQPQGAER